MLPFACFLGLERKTGSAPLPHEEWYPGNPTITFFEDVRTYYLGCVQCFHSMKVDIFLHFYLHIKYVYIISIGHYESITFNGTVHEILYFCILNYAYDTSFQSSTYSWSGKVVSKSIFLKKSPTI